MQRLRISYGAVKSFHGVRLKSTTNRTSLIFTNFGQNLDKISMDFINGLPPSQGYTVIMVTVDHLSKYTHFINLKHSYTSLIVTKVFITQIV